MPAPSSKQMAQLAKTQFVASAQLLPFEFPVAQMADPHWNGAFVSGELSVPPLPVSPNAALFLCVSTNQKHVETQAKISAQFHMYIDSICKAICCAWQDWAKQAVLQNVVINAANATAGMVTGPKWQPVIEKKGPGGTKMLTLYTASIAKAIGDAWTKYEQSLHAAGNPWYPKFAAATPGPQAPTKNVPCPVAMLQQDASMLTRAALSDAMLKNLNQRVSVAQVISIASCAAGGGGVTGAVASAAKGLVTGSIRPHSKALMDSIAYAFETVFKTWQSTSQVTKVMGSGTNPTQVTAPVVGGVGNMQPGGFDAATPDATMMFQALSKHEGSVSGFYDDHVGGPGIPDMSKPVYGYRDGSRAIGYGTDIGHDFDPLKLTKRQLFVRRLFNQLGYSNDDFVKFVNHELFLKTGEAEQLFGLSILDPQDGYIKEARSVFPELSSYPLPQQISAIDLMYNYGSKNLRDNGQHVIEAIKNRDWQAAADGVEKLPNHGKLYGQDQRGKAISDRLKTPIDDPCS